MLEDSQQPVAQLAESFAVTWEKTQQAYRQKIRKAAYNSAHTVPGYAVEDMEQELLVVLWETISLYNPEKNMKFNTFFWMRVQQRVAMLMRSANTLKRKAEWVSLDVEAVQIAVDHTISDFSAEDEALAAYHVRERIAVERGRNNARRAG